MRPLAWKMEQRCEDIRKGLLTLILVVLALFLFRIAGVEDAPAPSGSSGDGVIQIEGDVKYPGIYFFNNKINIKDLLEQSGGIKPEGLAEIPLHSGSRIAVQQGSNSRLFISGEISSFHRITLGMPVSINAESEEGLTAVPGIGPLLAQSIVNARTETGGFRSLEDLKSVPGIGDKTYKKIIGYITL